MIYNVYNESNRVSKLADPIRKTCQGEIDKVFETYKVEQDIPKLGNTLVDIVKKYDIVLKRLEYNSILKAASVEAMANSINKNNNISIIMTEYVYYILTSMAKKDVNKARDYLKSVIYLVGKFQDKDSFELYYKRMLDRRLLEPISNNLHLEKFFLERLTKELGSIYTKRLYQMIEDVEISKELTNQFLDATKSDIKLRFNPVVVNSIYWPKQKSFSCKLPQELFDIYSAFNTFYVDAHDAPKKLTWQPSRGSMVLKYGKSLVILGTVPASILLLFNEKNTFALNELLEASGIPKSNFNETILRLLQSKLIEKSGNNIALGANIEKKRKMYLKPRSLIETVRGVNIRELDIKRSALIDAAVIRVMKGAESSLRNKVIESVVIMLQHRFIAEPAVILMRILKLASKGFLEQSPAKSSDGIMVKYIA